MTPLDRRLRAAQPRPRVVGSAARDGVIIYAVTRGGTLSWYKHYGFESGLPSWIGPKAVGRGWGDLFSVFALLPGTPDVVR